MGILLVSCGGGERTGSRDWQMGVLLHVTQKTDKQGLSAVGIECEYFSEGSGMQARQFVFLQACEVVGQDKESATIVEALGHRASECSRPKQQQSALVCRCSLCEVSHDGP